MKNFIGKIAIIFCMALTFGFIGSSNVQAATTWDASTSDFPLSNNDLTINFDTGKQGGSVFATKAVTNGKWYWEITIDEECYSKPDTPIGTPAMFGVCDTNISANVRDSGSRGYYPFAKWKYPGPEKYGNGISSKGTVISVLLDMDEKKLEFWCNGISQGVACNDLGGASKVYPEMRYSTSNWSSKVTANFGASPFKYSIPKGYLPYDPQIIPSTLTLNKSIDNLQVGQTDTLIATITPDNATNKTVTWKSSDESIATVDQTGKVTAVKEGTATITATTTDGSNLSANCVVTVTPQGTTPTNPTDNTGNAILNLTMTNGNVKSYTVSMSKVNDFISWYNNRSAGSSGSPYYTFDKTDSNQPFSKKTEYVVFDKISSFEVDEYTKQ